MHKCVPTLTACLAPFSSAAVSAQTVSFDTVTYPRNDLRNPSFHISTDLNGDGRPDFISDAENGRRLVLESQHATQSRSRISSVRLLRGIDGWDFAEHTQSIEVR
jgi:hypothetical protein